MAMDKLTRNTMTSLLNPSIVSMSLFIVVDASVGGLSIVEHGISVQDRISTRRDETSRAELMTYWLMT